MRINGITIEELDFNQSEKVVPIKATDQAPVRNAIPNEDMGYLYIVLK